MIRRIVVAALLTCGIALGQSASPAPAPAASVTSAPALSSAQSPANHPTRGLKPFRGKADLLQASFLPIQFKNPKDLGVGKLLVAGRGMGDPRFAQTVILLVHYDEDGVVGLVLNRRTDVPLSQVLDLKAAKDRSDPVYIGGPVQPAAVFALFQSPGKIEKAENIFGDVYWISDKSVFEKTLSPGLTPRFFTFTWDIPDGRRLNCGPRCRWARGSCFRQTPPQYSIPIRLPCGCT